MGSEVELKKSVANARTEKPSRLLPFVSRSVQWHNRYVDYTHGEHVHNSVESRGPYLNTKAYRS